LRRRLMSGYTPPHVEYLRKAIEDPASSPARLETARRILASETWLMVLNGGCFPSRDPAISRLESRYDFSDHSVPRYALPRPATRAESVAMVMMIEGHLKAAELGVDLGECLVDALFLVGSPRHERE
jgi:hypothetical protein